MYRRVSHLFFPAPTLWITTLALTLVMVVWAYLADFKIELGTDYTVFYVLAAGIVLGLIYHKRSPFIATFGFSLSLFMAMSMVLRPLSYLAVYAKFPLFDEKLAWFDRLIGFDWLSHVAWVNSSPIVNFVLDYSYQSITLQFVFIFYIFYVSQNYERLREIVMVFFIMGMVTTFISMFTPAAGAFHYYKPDAAITDNLSPYAGRYFQAHFLALYNGQMHGMVFGNSTGLIAFPSFHTQAAVLYIWATRRTIFFWPAVLLNLSMIVSTITFGGHYVADLLAGVVVAAASAYAYGLWAGRYRLSLRHLRITEVADQTGLKQAPVIAWIKAQIARRRKVASAQV